MSRRLFFALLLLSACSTEKPPPPIAAGLPTDVREATVEFNRRVGQQFPLGTEETVVRSTLSADGFEVGRLGAGLTRNNYPCSTKWMVNWRSAAGKLTNIHGEYGYICP